MHANQRAKRRFIAGTLSIAVTATLGARADAAEPAQLPPDSLYQLPMVLEDQLGERRNLDQLRGSCWIVALFYASCPYTCPLTIETLQMIEAKLTELQRARLKFLLVSLDPERDTPAQLLKLAQSRGAQSPRWLLARTAVDQVRPLAAALSVQYRRLPDGEFSHSTVLTLIDAQGRIRARSARIGQLDAPFLAALGGVLDTDPGER